MKSNPYILLSLLALATAACAISDEAAPATENDNGKWYEGTLETVDGPVSIHYQMRDGVPIAEGDIELRGLEGSVGVQPRGYAMGSETNSSFYSGKIWPNGRLSYRFDISVQSGSALRTTIDAAIAEIHRTTRLRLELDTNNTATDYLLFRTGSAINCSSPVGYYGGVHRVNLGTGCNDLDVVIHELGHALGLQHEMSRADRNNYLSVQTANIKNGKANNFTVTTGRPVGRVDFDSVMLYPSFTTDASFAINTSLPIITRRDGSTYLNPQEGNGFSSSDIDALATLYGSQEFPYTRDVRFEDRGIWSQAFCSRPTDVLGTGDFNGDGRTDLFCHEPMGSGTPANFWVMLSNGAGFEAPSVWLNGWCHHKGATLGTGDFDGDGQTDLYCHDPMNGQSGGNTHIVTSTGHGFSDRGIWLGGWCSHAGATFGVGDFDGNGKTDLYCHDPMDGKSGGNTWVATSTGSKFSDGSRWLNGWCSHAGASFGTADLNGDQKTDFYCHDPFGSGTPANFHVATSTGNGMTARGSWLNGWCNHKGASVGMADFNGDGKTDLYCHDPMDDRSSGNTHIATSTGGGFSDRGIWLGGWCSHAGAAFGVADFNGDRKADLFCHDPPRGATGPTNTWLAISTGTSFGVNPGNPRLEGWCSHAGTAFYTADLTGDKAADLLCRDPRGTSSAGNTFVVVAKAF